MIDLLFQIGLSNVLIALGLALIALLVELTARRPVVAHFLWLLVFIKLLTPSFLPIRLSFLPAGLSSLLTAWRDAPQVGPGTAEFALEGSLASGSAPAGSALGNILPLLAALWLAGSLLILLVSIRRVSKFQRLLGRAAVNAPPEVNEQAAAIAEQLGFRSPPVIKVTNASMSPLVWWAGGKPWIVIPTCLLRGMDYRQFRWVLAHELAHVRRGDHLTRWIEWLACVCFWWNPLVWWARYHLRINEELCCDSLVVSTLKPDPHTYAESLLIAIERLVEPVVQVPAVASEMNSGGFIERRLRMITSRSIRKTGPWVLGLLGLCALVILPLSIAHGDTDAKNQKEKTEQSEKAAADSFDLEALELQIKADLKAGKITNEEAEAKLKELYRKAEIWTIESDLKAAELELQIMVEAGKITREEADAKLKDLHRKAEIWSIENELKSAELELQKLVEAGKITEQEAIAKLAELAKQSAIEHERIDLKAVELKLKELVKAGEISEKEAEARLKELHEQAAMQSMQMDLKAAQHELQQLVAAGKITKEEATAKLKELERQVAAEYAEVNLKAIELELKELVAAGEITKEEAEAKLKELQKRAASEAEPKKEKSPKKEGEESSK